MVAPGEFQIAAAFHDHGHIHGQCNGLRDSGATIKWVYDPDPGRVQTFLEHFPQAQVAPNFRTILEDPDIKLVASAAVPSERAAIGTAVMQAGKDYFTDKSPFTSLLQLEDARDVVAATGAK